MGFIKIPFWLGKKLIDKSTIKNAHKHRSFGDFNIKADLNYSSDEIKEHKLDIYTPAQNGNGITLFYIHGGAYACGYKEDNHVFCSWFVSKGFNVVTMNYRLVSKENRISVKDQIQDIFESLKFILDNKLSYGLKTNEIFLVGDSAGGHLALLVDAIYKDKEAKDFFGIKELPNIKILGAALNSTMYDYVFLRDYAKGLMYKSGFKVLFSEHANDDEFIKHCSPKYYFEKQTYKPCKLFASTSLNDIFYNQSRWLKKDCEKFDYEIDYLLETSPRKEVGHVYNHIIFDEEGLKCNQAMADFFIKNAVIDK